MNREEKAYILFQQHFEDMFNKKIESAIINKIVQIALSDDLQVIRRLEPHVVTTETELTLTTGFKIDYEPFRVKKKYDKAIEALKEISKGKYELNPWTSGPSSEAQIAIKILQELGE